MRPKLKNIPDDMLNDKVEEYYEILSKKRISFAIKRIFDIFGALVLIILLSPLLLVIGILIKVDSKGPIIYKQNRITQYGKVFKVCKFRTMVDKADQIGSHVTANNDQRVTSFGKKIRGTRLDELPQLFNIIAGTMSFVGTRPEAVKYVEKYTDEMKATLLLPAGVTSEASIMFRDEAEMLLGEEDIDEAYVRKILPEKMKYNLESLTKFSFLNDIKTLFRTVGAVVKSGDE